LSDTPPSSPPDEPARPDEAGATGEPGERGELPTPDRRTARPTGEGTETGIPADRASLGAPSPLAQRPEAAADTARQGVAELSAEDAAIADAVALGTICGG